MDLTTGASAESASPAALAWRSRWLTVARRAWPVVTGLALVANLLALPGFARSQLNHTIRAELPAWHLSPAGYVAVMIGFPAVFMLVCLLISAVIFFRAAGDPVALLCAYMLMAFGCGLSFLPGVMITDPVLNALSVILTSAGLVLVGWFFLVFPPAGSCPAGVAGACWPPRQECWPWWPRAWSKSSQSRMPSSRSGSCCLCWGPARRSTGTAGSRP